LFMSAFKAHSDAGVRSWETAIRPQSIVVLTPFPARSASLRSNSARSFSRGRTWYKNRSPSRWILPPRNAAYCNSDVVAARPSLFRMNKPLSSMIPVISQTAQLFAFTSASTEHSMNPFSVRVADAETLAGRGGVERPQPIEQRRTTRKQCLNMARRRWWTFVDNTCQVYSSALRSW